MIITRNLPHRIVQIADKHSWKSRLPNFVFTASKFPDGCDSRVFIPENLKELQAGHPVCDARIFCLSLSCRRFSPNFSKSVRLPRSRKMLSLMKISW